DILTRSHVFLLEAIASLLRRRPELEDVLELHLAGVVSGADLAAIDGAPFVHVHGYVPHDETVPLLRHADLLSLPMQNPPAGRPPAASSTSASCTTSPRSSSRSAPGRRNGRDDVQRHEPAAHAPDADRLRARRSTRARGGRRAVHLRRTARPRRGPGGAPAGR